MKKQKKKKIILAICIFLLITAAVSSVFITKHHRFTQTKNLFLSQNLELYDDFRRLPRLIKAGALPQALKRLYASAQTQLCSILALIKTIFPS